MVNKMETRLFRDVPVNGYFKHNSVLPIDLNVYVKVSPGKIRRVGASEVEKFSRRALEVLYIGKCNSSRASLT